MKNLLLKFQRNEITEYHIYQKLAKTQKDPANRKVLLQIADDEKRHYEYFKTHTNQDTGPKKFSVFFYTWIARLFGLTFGIKLMEKGEEQAQANYEKLIASIPEAKNIMEDEDAHEKQLINMLNEELLDYVGSIVLGLNDALVELTGALAGLTFALQNTQLIALTGLITGIAASFSMAASEYLSTKSEGESHKAGRAAVYTGIAYIVTVLLLILPYLLFSHYMVCLGLTLLIAVSIIFFFNYYISVAKDLDFLKRFLEMAGLSLGVSLITFGIGVVIRLTLGIEV
ncbi:MAG: VIT1/CCC1 transporter family protein [Spirochaetales bacterium]|nr:VIT1/CCC1 transporter family protein [Spirochaetales bacterium]